MQGELPQRSVALQVTGEHRPGRELISLFSLWLIISHEVEAGEPIRQQSARVAQSEEGSERAAARHASLNGNVEAGQPRRIGPRPHGGGGGGGGGEAAHCMPSMRSGSEASPGLEYRLLMNP